MARRSREEPGNVTSRSSEDLAERTKHFTGREWVFRNLDAFLGDSESTFLLIGGPGSGKSTIAARLVEMSAGEASGEGYRYLHKGAITYAHFCRADTIGTLDPLQFVRDLSEELATRYPAFLSAITSERTEIKVIQKEFTAQEDARVTGIEKVSITLGNLSPRLASGYLLREPLKALQEEEEDLRVVVLVDALDEGLTFSEDDGETLVGLLVELVRDLPRGLRFILTSRPEDRVLRRLRPSLDLIADAPDDAHDVLNYAKRRLLKSHRLRPKAEDLAGDVALASKGIFLYARYVIEDLIANPERGTVAGLSNLPPGLGGIYREFLERELVRTSSDWEKIYRPVLGALAVAHGDGLALNQLCGATELEEDDVHDAVLACDQFLLGPDDEGRYRIYHNSFREFLISDSTYQVFPALSHFRLAAHFLRSWGEDWSSCDDSYALTHTPTHLVQAIQGASQPTDRRARTESLVSLLTNLTFLEAKTGRLGIDQVLEDFRYALPELPAEVTNVRHAYRVLDLESHNLRGWDRRVAPGFFAQQVRNRALILHHDALADAATGRLKSLKVPHWDLRWRSRGLSAELERTLIGHDGPVRAVAMSADGSRAASGSADGTLRVWNLSDGRQLQRLEARDQGSGRTMMPKNRDRQVWDTEAGRLILARSRRRKSVGSVAITPDGSRALSGSRDRNVRLWDTEAGKELLILPGHADSVTTVAITEDGRRALSGSFDGTVRIWDLDAGVESRTFSGLGGPVLGVAVTPDGRWGVCGTWDRTAWVWNLSTGDKSGELRGHDAQVSAVAITDHGDRVLTGSRDHTLKIWDVATGKELGTLAGHQQAVEDVALTAGGQIAISSSWDRTVKVWDVESGREIRTLTGHEDQVWAVAASADGKLAVSGSWDRTVRVWNLREDPGRLMEQGHDDVIEALSVTEDDRLAVSGSRDCTARIWNVQSGREFHVLRGHTKRVSAVAFTPNAELVVTGSWDGTLKSWNVATGSEVKTLFGHRAAVLCLVISPDGRRAVSGSWDHELRSWDLLTGRTISTLAGHSGPVWAAVLLPNERVLSASNDSRLRIWNIDTGDLAMELAGHEGPVTCLSVTSDGLRVISGSRDRTVRAWDVDTGDMLWLSGASEAEIVAVSVTSGGKVIAGTRDGQIRIMTVDEGQELPSLKGHVLREMEWTAPPIAVRAMPGGSAAITGGFDRRLIHWDLAAGGATAIAALDGAITALGTPSEEGSILVGDAAGCLYRMLWTAD